MYLSLNIELKKTGDHGEENKRIYRQGRSQSHLNIRVLLWPKMKMGNIIHIESRKDIRTLPVDAEVFQEDLEMTKRDLFTMVKGNRIKGLEKMSEYLKNLEYDLIIKQVDCITLMGQTYQDPGNWQLFNCFYLTFFTIDDLLKKLNKMRNIERGEKS